MTQASETTDLPVREPGRAVIIAAIHAYAEWLVDHPEVPAPHSIHATASIDPARLERFAEANDFRRRPDSPVALITVAAYEPHGVLIQHGVVAGLVGVE
jgi:hypothetical protein